MANRDWDEPLFSRTFEGAGRTPSKAEVRDTVADAVRGEADSGSGPCRDGPGAMPYSMAYSTYV
ncbi:hypothetical protein GCM10009837_71200 [Streptomyces durmitorensis]